MAAKSFPRSLRADDWTGWVPVDRATSIYLVRGGRVLLIRKKRGLGRGKVTAPGGKIDGSESAAECAIREAREEVGLTPDRVQARGRLSFQFLGGYSIDVHLFVAHRWSGELCETEEASPFWAPLDRIPYGEMWEDDRIWLDDVLSGRVVTGRLLFDGDRLVDHEILVKAAETSSSAPS
jgi:8-oxo-dGTP diphosphatase